MFSSLGILFSVLSLVHQAKGFSFGRETQGGAIVATDRELVNGWHSPDNLLVLRADAHGRIIAE